MRYNVTSQWVHIKTGIFNRISSEPRIVDIRGITARTRAVLIWLSMMLAVCSPAGAFGIRFVNLPAIPPASQKITIDGRLDDWKGVDGFLFDPNQTGGLVGAGGNPALAAMLRLAPTVKLRSCYDSNALYLAVEWKDTAPGTNRTPAGEANHWPDGGEGVELHVLTDGMLHMACWPAGKGFAVMTRRDDDTAWKEASTQITAVGAPGADASTFVQEIKIPWAVLTKTGAMPADGKIELGADFGWNAIDAKIIDALRQAAAATRANLPGVPFCFLTLQPPELGSGGLLNPSEWGDLEIGGTTSGDQAVKAREQTSLAKMPTPEATRPPPMDGTLDGWNPAGFQTAACLPGFWGDRFQCCVATQYDAQNLYLAAHFSTRHGYTNIKPESSQLGFAGGDALQLRLNNGSKTVNLCGWYDGVDGRPALTADGKDLDKPFLLTQGAREQFKMDADGRGYVQEITVPWSLLFGAAPNSSQPLRASLQFWFADLTSRFSLFGNTTLERRGAIPVAYKMPVDGQLTLGLFDKTDHLLKWLVQDEYRYAGDNTLFWDGLDQWGNAVVPGDYVLKAVCHPPITLDYKMTLLNPGTPPWPTSDDKGDWLSDEADAQAVATDGKWVFLAAPGCEKGFSVIALDEKGQRQWGMSESFNPRSVSLDVSGDDLYMLYSGPEITDTSRVYTGDNAIGRAVLLCVDKRTGEPVKFTRNTSHLRVATWPYRDAASYLWDLRNNKSFSPLNYGGQPRYFKNDIGESTDALGLMVVRNKVYISMPYENKLLVLDAETGASLNDDIPINSPVGLCALDDHTLLAVSGTTVVKVDVVTRQVTPFISTHLVAPDSITLDRQGRIYVSDWGNSFQVKTFDRDGKFLHAIGKPGGRPWVGKWDPNGMLVPRGIAVTDDGKLWVAEDDGSPERVSVWDTNTLDFIRDYIGPAPYGGGTDFWIDPKDPTEVNAEGTRFKVDYNKKTWTPQAIIYRKASKAAAFTPSGHDLGGYQVRIVYREGREYAFANTSSRMCVILQRRGEIYQPAAAVGSFPYDPDRRLTPDSDAIYDWDSDIMNHAFPHYYPDFFAGHMNNNYTWTDTNGDGHAQPDEMHWLPTQGHDQAYADGTQATWDGIWNYDMSPDFSLFYPERFKDKLAIMRLDVKGWTSAGAPIYDPADAKSLIQLPLTRNIFGMHVTNDRKLVISYTFEDNKTNDPNSISCFDLDGKPLWDIAMPERMEGKNVHANCVAYDYNVPGIGDVVCTWAYHGSERPYFFTTDGLYIGTALDDTLLGPTAVWSESAKYFYQAPDGTPWLINGANQQEHILKINGLEKGSRFEGTLSLTQADIDAAASVRNHPVTKIPPKPVVSVRWLATPPSIDGNLTDWNMDTGVRLDGGNGRTADIALGRDETNLYLAYRVHEPTPPLANGGKDWRDLFVTGDGVDLMLGTNPRADPHRRDAAAGDERLFLTVFQGKPSAVLYQPVVPGTTEPVHLGSAQIDRITRLDSAKVAVRRDPANGFYTLEASVPLRDLSVDPGRENALRGDVGVIFADESGRNRAERVYYYDKDTSIVFDVPTEARLQPKEWGAVDFPLGGPNLIRNGGFEEPLMDSPDKVDQGWIAEAQSNGGGVSINSDSPYSGHHALVLDCPVSPTVSPAEYDDPNYDAGFIKSLNGGAHAEVAQRMPVIAGHSYRLRYRFRGVDFQEERKDPGRPRGYIAFGGRLDWQCQTPNPSSTVNLGDTKVAPDDWQEITDHQNGSNLPRLVIAPPGATSALIHFELTVCAEGHHPRAFVDDVEFIEVPAGTTP